MKAYTYVALPVITDPLKGKHVTLAFVNIENDVKLKFDSPKEFLYTTSHICDIQYWEDAGVLVALLDKEPFRAVFDYYKSNGWTYNYEFRPHVTLMYTNDKPSSKVIAELKERFLNERIVFGAPYCSIKTRKQWK